MSYLLEEFERVVFNINNPADCKYVEAFKNNSETKPDPIFKSNHRLILDMLNLGISNIPPETIKHQIGLYQQSAIRILDKIDYSNCHCPYDNLCFSKIKKPSVDCLVEFLKFLESQFPDCFNSRSKIPKQIFNKYKQYHCEIVNRISNMLNDEEIDCLHLPSTELVIYKKDNCTFKEIRYFNTLITETSIRLKKTQKSDEVHLKLIELYIEYNFNAKSIYDYIINLIINKIKPLTNSSCQISKLKYYRKSISQIVPAPEYFYIEKKASLKDSLITWINKEIAQFNYGYFIKENNGSFQNEFFKENHLSIIKCNLSVKQIACMLRILIEHDVFPCYGDKKIKNNIIRQFSEILASKYTDSISYNSLYNSYHELEDSSLNAVKQLFLELYKSIKV
ncbi:hypothetical protein [Plebeiibacterium marinum]|uniref:Uncharacterized protein n=1 Tax=Plebeiibacterium marinum TaxID=2992111 RepID=A0AAE3MIE0_9BACT|nr:hypothetical protein [Plebeiobacterium marinum]MCW3808094.1 hypothetical protein [Plebeiobacterium marinum]